MRKKVSAMLEIVVCDDDIADLECAVTMLHKIFTSQKIAYHIEQFASANQMLENISNIDIGILDISMEELNGIKLGRKLKEKFPDVKLVYITSYEEYCMQVINEVHAFSFLCKPLEYDKLETQMLELLDQLPDTGAEKDFYKVTDSNGKEYLSIKLKLRDILYFEYIKRSRKVLIALADITYEYDCIFEKLVEELQPYDFVVNCRGNLVNLRHIEKIKGFTIYLDNGKEYLSIKLKLRDILYFEYIKRSRKVLIALSDITYEYDCIFEKLVEELQPYDFVVNCRGNLVNLRHIEKIKGFIIYMDNGKELQIAQTRSNDFREEVNKFLQRNS